MHYPDLAMVSSKAFLGFCVSKARSLTEIIKVESTAFTENESIMAPHFQVNVKIYLIIRKAP